MLPPQFSPPQRAGMWLGLGVVAMGYIVSERLSLPQCAAERTGRLPFHETWGCERFIAEVSVLAELHADHVVIGRGEDIEHELPLVSRVWHIGIVCRVDEMECTLLVAS